MRASPPAASGRCWERIPWYALLTLACLLPLSPFLSNVAIVVGLLGWALRGIRQRRLTIRAPHVVVLFLLFVGAGLLSMVNSVSLAASLQGLIKIFRALGIFVLVSEEVSTEARLRGLVTALLVGAVIASADGILQWFIGTDLIYRYPVGGQLKGLNRICGPYHHPNDFGLFLSVIIPIGLAAIRAASSRHLRYFSGIAVILSMAALLLTFSRGALLGVGTACLGLIVAWRAWRWLAGCLVFSLVVIACLPAPIKTWIHEQPNLWAVLVESRLPGESRPQIWRDATSMIADHPWVGVGVNTFVLNYNRYRVPGDMMTRPPYAHNQYLQMLAEVGVVGLMVFLLLLAAACWQVLKAYRALQDPLRGLVLGVAFGLVAFLISGVMESALYYPRQVPLFWTGFGLLFSAPFTPCRPVAPKVARDGKNRDVTPGA